MAIKELKLGPPIHFYNGTITLRFDEGSWTYYRVLPSGDLETQYGVTGVCGIIDKSLYLVPWACKMMYLKLLRTIPSTGEGSDRRTVEIPWKEFDELLLKAKVAHQDILEDAVNVGKAAHTWIEGSIKNAITFTGGVVEKLNDFAPVDERSISCGLAAFDWMKKHNVRWLSTERTVYSRKYRFAGTCDGQALVDSCSDEKCCPKLFLDELSVIDWKSSNHLSTQYLYQTAAYQQALMEETGEPIKARWILRLGKEDGAFEAWYETNFKQDFSGYLACLRLKQIHKMVEKRMSELKKLKTFRKREAAKEEKNKIKFKKRDLQPLKKDSE